MQQIHYLCADGTSRIEPSSTIPEREICTQFLAGSPEQVWVLFNDKRTCMLVNENGIAQGLPINSAATEIYLTWPRKKGLNVTGRHIHGNAIVFEDIEIT